MLTAHPAHRNNATTTFVSPGMPGIPTSSRLATPYTTLQASEKDPPSLTLHLQVNPKYISVNWEASGGGAFAVIPLEERGRMPEQIPLFRGHTAAVLDTDWYGIRPLGMGWWH
jgi:hypothetical protein